MKTYIIRIPVTQSMANRIKKDYAEHIKLGTETQIDIEDFYFILQKNNLNEGFCRYLDKTFSDKSSKYTMTPSLFNGPLDGTTHFYQVPSNCHSVKDMVECLQKRLDWLNSVYDKLPIY